MMILNKKNDFDKFMKLPKLSKKEKMEKVQEICKNLNIVLEKNFLRYKIYIEDRKINGITIYNYKTFSLDNILIFLLFSQIDKNNIYSQYAILNSKNKKLEE